MFANIVGGGALPAWGGGGLTLCYIVHCFLHCSLLLLFSVCDILQTVWEGAGHWDFLTPARVPPPPPPEFIS